MKEIDELIEKYEKALNNIKKSVGKNPKLGGMILIASYKEYVKDLEQLKEQLKEQRELCEGKCGMNYCDDNGCIDRKRNLVEPKDNTEHCG